MFSEEFLESLLFESPEDAQKLIDDEYPGYDVAVSTSGKAVIFDPDDRIIHCIIPDNSPVA